MKRNLIVAVSIIGFPILLIAFSFTAIITFNYENVWKPIRVLNARQSFPSISETSFIKAKVFKTPWGLDETKYETITGKDYSELVTFINEYTIERYPSYRYPVVCNVRICKRDGKTLDLKVYSTGKNSLSFSIDGVRYIRKKKPTDPDLAESAVFVDMVMGAMNQGRR